jgi:hypothetical protein
VNAAAAMTASRLSSDARSQSAKGSSNAIGKSRRDGARAHGVVRLESSYSGL